MPRRPRKNLRKKVRFNPKKNKKNITFEDPEIRKRWDKSKSPHQNYQNLGLKLNPNVDDKITTDNPVEFKVPEVAPRPKDKRMTKMEELYYRALVDKHGTNFKAMERDIKLNYYQYSETKLEKRALFYIEAYRKPKEEKKRKREELETTHTKHSSKKKNTEEEEEDDEDEEDDEGEEEAEDDEGGEEEEEEDEDEEGGDE